jgi:hypothetical protein
MIHDVIPLEGSGGRAVRLENDAASMPQGKFWSIGFPPAGRRCKTGRALQRGGIDIRDMALHQCLRMRRCGKPEPRIQPVRIAGG